MHKFDIFDLNLTSITILKNGYGQILFIMTNYASLVCIQTEIAGLKVCHFHLDLFLNLNGVFRVGHFSF